MFRHCMLLLVPFLALAAPAFAAESDVKAELFADTTAVQAGTSFRLAVRLTPHRGWHTYWKNPGDAGLPTRITWHLPPGFSAGPTHYPLPEKLEQPGGILCYAYDHPAVFITTITPPALRKPLPPTLSIQATVSWLSCKESCIPGKATLDLSLPTGTASPANADVFDPATALLPSLTVPTIVEHIAPLDSTSDHLAARIQWKDDVTNVQLFPDRLDSMDVANITLHTANRQTRIDLEARILAGQHPPTDGLPVLITYRDRAGVPHGFYTAITLHAPAPAGTH